MQNFGANVASCDEDLMIRFANRKALEVIAPEEITKTASRTKERSSIDGTIDQQESSKFNLESFQNQEQAFDNEIQSSVRFEPYLVDHNSIQLFFEDRVEFTLKEVVKNYKYWKESAKKEKKDLYIGCKKPNT